MSKQRAKVRAERTAEAQRLAEAERLKRERLAVDRERRERRALIWRRLRLWQHGTGFRRNKETWAALGILALVLLGTTYLFTSSLKLVLVVALVIVVAAPAVVILTFDRSDR